MSLVQAILRETEVLAGFIRRSVKNNLSSRTGGLARSFRVRLIKKGPDVFGAAAESDLPYAGIQDAGGTILPKTTRNLAIPIPGKVPLGKWPRDFAPGQLQLIVSKRGQALLARVQDRERKKLDVLFVLKRSVQITGTNYLAEAREAYLKDGGAEALKSIGATIDKADTE